MASTELKALSSEALPWATRAEHRPPTWFALGFNKPRDPRAPNASKLGHLSELCLTVADSFRSAWMTHFLLPLFLLFGNQTMYQNSCGRASSAAAEYLQYVICACRVAPGSLGFWVPASTLQARARSPCRAELAQLREAKRLAH